MGNHPRSARHHRRLAAIVTGVILVGVMGATAMPASAEPVYLPGSIVDSVPVAPGAGYVDLPTQVTAPVTSPDSASIYVYPTGVVRAAYDVTALDTATRSIRATASFSEFVQQVVVSVDSSTVYVVTSPSNAGDAPRTLSVVDAGTMAIRSRVALGGATSIAVAPDGRHLVLARMGEVAELDTTTLTISPPVAVIGAQAATPHVSPDSQLAYVSTVDTSGGAFTYGVTVVDLTAGVVVRSLGVSGTYPVTWASDLSFVILGRLSGSGAGPTTFTRLDLLTGATSEITAPQGYSRGAVLTADDSRLVAMAPHGVTVVDLENGNSSFVALGADENAGALVTVPHTPTVLVKSSREVYLLDAGVPSLISRVPDYTPGGLASLVVTPDGSWAFESLSTDQSSGERGLLGVIDLTTIGWHPATTRLAGESRYTTAVAASQAGFPTSAPVVYVASGTDFPDALSAGAAAGAQDGPLLLTDPNALPAEVSAEIRRLHPAKIVIVGGGNSVSPQTEASLRTLAGTVTRIAGDDRYATGRAVVGAAFSAGAKHVYVASGQTFPDALSASAAAGAHDEPLIIVNGSASHVDDATKALLTRLGATSFTVVGGTGTVPAGVAADLAALGTVTRLAGADRYATSVAVNAAAFPDPSAAYLAAGAQFPDALSGGAIAAHAGAPLYVVPQNCVPDAGLRHLAASDAASVALIGGASTLWDQVADLRLC